MTPRHALALAARALWHSRGRTLLTALALALPLALPWAVHRLSDGYVQGLAARAEATPLVLGAPGSQVDLTLAALWLRPAPLAPLPASVADAVRAEGLGGAVPLHLRYSARGRPLVGTRVDYFARRGLQPAQGTHPLQLGDAVLGAEAAAALGLGVGDRIITDAAHPFDLARSQPVRLRVVGVLAPTGGPDDGVIFTDVLTTWVVDGLIHGHRDPTRGDAGEVVLGPGDAVALDLDPARLGQFHPHGDLADAPLTAVLVFPTDAKAKALLAGRLGRLDGVRVVRPDQVVAQLAGLVLKLRRLLDAHQALVAASTALFVALVIGLGLRARAAELRALVDVGASRAAVVVLQAAEWGLIGALALALAAAGAALGVWLLPDPARWT
ncbi:MAG: hypothetical protein H6702_20800 [Myxococcales bacterium]|nr:hypothetical protein [Myxococcales bacterium]